PSRAVFYILNHNFENFTFMKKIFILLAAILFPLPALAQMFFEDAYIIDSRGSRKEVLIKNEGWVENPSTVVIKDGVTAKESSLGLNDIEEFGFVNGTTFRKFTVPIAHYEDDLSKIDSNPDLIPQIQTVFLRVLATGAV